jgi:DNA-binding LacI/PurR family transcriptional regulator
MGALAAKLLIGILRGDEPEQTLCKIPTRLIVRESCQPPAS